MLSGRFPLGFRLGFRLALHHKDLQIALEDAAATGLSPPLSERVAAMEAKLMAAGFGHDDMSGLARWFEPPAGGGPVTIVAATHALAASAAFAWDQGDRDGQDGWQLGADAPPLAAFPRQDQRRPLPPGRVLVPDCGRGHEAARLAELGFAAIGLDISGEALREARRLHGPERPGLSWLQADLLDPAALAAAGLADGSLQGVLEHTCFCAIDPPRRADYLRAMTGLLAPGGWLLELFWCHNQPGGPPFGSDPQELAGQRRGAGLPAPAAGTHPGLRGGAKRRMAGPLAATGGLRGEEARTVPAANQAALQQGTPRSGSIGMGIRPLRVQLRTPLAKPRKEPQGRAAGRGDLLGPQTGGGEGAIASEPNGASISRRPPSGRMSSSRQAWRA